jgi:predicted alpha/beta hydrolase
MARTDGIAIRKCNLVAADATVIGATLFSPEAPNGRVLVIAGAIGVKQSFYARFAKFLATRGFVVLTFDYRGIGESLGAGIAQARGGLSAWGEQDLAAALDFCAGLAPERDLAVVGHSAGGQLVGLTESNRPIRAMLAVSAQTGSWRLWPKSRQWALFLLWRVVMPGLTRLFGYFPARVLGLGENLPRDAALEWARWCASRDYFVDGFGRPLVGAFDGLRAPLRALVIADDGMAPEAAVRALLRWYANAEIEIVSLRPENGGIGHFGFFREAGARHWDAAADWLMQANRPPAPL